MHKKKTFFSDSFNQLNDKLLHVLRWTDGGWKLKTKIESWMSMRLKFNWIQRCRTMMNHTIKHQTHISSNLIGIDLNIEFNWICSNWKIIFFFLHLFLWMNWWLKFQQILFFRQWNHWANIVYFDKWFV